MAPLKRRKKAPWHLFSSIPFQITADPWKYWCKRSLTVQGSQLTLEAQPHSSSETQCGLPREGISHRREVPGSTSTSAAPPAWAATCYEEELSVSMGTVKTLPTHLVLNLQHTLHCHPCGPDSVNPLHLSAWGHACACVKYCSAGQHLSQAPCLHALLHLQVLGKPGGEVMWFEQEGDRLGLFLGLGGKGGLLKWVFLFSSPLSTLAEPCS